MVEKLKGLGIALILFATLCRCSTSVSGSRKLEFPDYTPQTSVRFGTKGSAALPWEMGALGRDFRGREIKDRDLLKADTAMLEGRYSEAFDIYRVLAKKNGGSNSPQEFQYLLAMRLSSSALAADQPEKGIRHLSSYFKQFKVETESVDSRASLMLGFSYGRAVNTDQSLAWFSSAYRKALKEGQLSEGVASKAVWGAKALLASLPEKDFELVSSSWENDSLVRGWIGEERAARAAGIGRSVKPGRFWEIVPLQGGDALKSASSDSVGTIGVILPLSGQYAPLGNSLKRGIELAQQLSGLSQIKLIFRDEGEGGIQAVREASDLSLEPSLKIILGPLFSESSERVRTVLDRKVPMMAFAKSASYKTDESALRFAPTVRDQVRPLVQAVSERFQLRRFAIAYPNDSQGRSFALALRAELAARNLQLVFEKSYTASVASDSDALLNLASELEKSPADAVLLPDRLPTAIRILSALSPARKKSLKILGTFSWDNPLELSREREQLDGALVVTPFQATSDQGTARSFIQAYQQKFGAAPDFFAAQGFDAASLVFLGLKRSSGAEDSSSGDLLSALQNLPLYEGVSGGAQILPSGEIERNFVVLELHSENRSPAAHASENPHPTEGE